MVVYQGNLIIIICSSEFSVFEKVVGRAKIDIEFNFPSNVLNIYSHSIFSLLNQLLRNSFFILTEFNNFQRCHKLSANIFSGIIILNAILNLEIQ